MALNKLLDSGSDIEKINNLKKQLSKQFAMKDLGAAKQILGMRIIRDKANGTLKLSQSEYVKKVLSRFNMNEAKPVSTPLGSHFKLSKEQSPKTEEERDHMSKVPYASAIGSLMYAMVCTRPDIAHAVGVVSRFMSRPGKQHWEAVKWILRYLKGSLDTCLCFTGASLKLQGYVDADFAGDIDSRKSTTGFVFTLGGTAISWASNLQKIVTLSTTEAEYVAATEAGKEMIWLHGFLDELGKKQEMGILHSDSQSAIFLAKNSAFHSKSKHIQTKYHFIRYLVEDKLVILEKICGSKNPADMLTKGVTIEKLKLCTASIAYESIQACQMMEELLGQVKARILDIYRLEFQVETRAQAKRSKEEKQANFSKYGCYVMAWMQSHGNFLHPEVISYELLEGEVLNSKFCINPLEPISMAIESQTSEIEISDVSQLKQLPVVPSKVGLPTTLRSLSISDFSRVDVLLPELFRCHHPVLENLSINGGTCDSLSLSFSILDIFPRRGIISQGVSAAFFLTHLSIGNLPNLKSLDSRGLQQLTSLLQLHIGNCPELQFSIGSVLQRLISLKELRIWLCRRLQSLTEAGLHHLTTLETLRISGCPKVQYLTKERLPDSLSYLFVYDCPSLEQRCQFEKGQEWRYISHIPKILINRVLF
ncbi:Retrovirus-related Pol polyprotein from transposon TNT 1-94 [Vitis vinifera]|uniref:Retrovirus-related Pol polyprotein from transposon TNT 1-94 n=1 Tax=Vitis vinifera TaxID=29760 RepID=A0A438I2N4_VITVI|nr:Retrovirus-related Pol polyprotein from transposon TNT 1-94 [Vitis vinifera]